MNKPYRVRDPKTGLWVAPDTQDLRGFNWTTSKEMAQVFEEEETREFWEKLGYEIVEVK